MAAEPLTNPAQPVAADHGLAERFVAILGLPDTDPEVWDIADMV